MIHGMQIIIIYINLKLLHNSKQSQVFYFYVKKWRIFIKLTEAVVQISSLTSGDTGDDAITGVCFEAS